VKHAGKNGNVKREFLAIHVVIANNFLFNFVEVILFQKIKKYVRNV
jgi:hypothetical protein